MASEKENNIDYVKTSFNHNQGLIQLADNKANIVIGVISVLFPLIFGVEIYTTLREDATGLKIFMFVTFILLVILLGIAFLLSIFTIHPRTKSNYKDHIFFQNIKEMKLDNYINFIKQEKICDFILDDYARENFAIAEINCEKFHNFKYSIYFLVGAIFFLVLRYSIFYGILLSS